VFMLTPREREVFTLYAQGYSDPEIAEMLFVCVKTVDKHKQNVRVRLGMEFEGRHPSRLRRAATAWFIEEEVERRLSAAQEQRAADSTAQHTAQAQQGCVACLRLHSCASSTS